ncbi:MAG: hypothetical protein R2764_17375 [Bacteroidales bacterium]
MAGRVFIDDGSVVSVGSSFLEFEVVIQDSLFIVVRHRNHLGVLSAFPAIQSNGIYSYDFTSDATMTYGGAGACKEVIRYLGDDWR